MSTDEKSGLPNPEVDQIKQIEKQQLLDILSSDNKTFASSSDIVGMSGSGPKGRSAVWSQAERRTIAPNPRMKVKIFARPKIPLGHTSKVILWGK